MKQYILLIVLLCISVPVINAEDNAIALSNEQCRQMALKASEEMQQAKNAVEKARLSQDVARTNFFPKLDGSAMAAYMPNNTDMMGMELVMKGTYMAGLQLTQPIYAGGKISAGYKLSKIGRNIAEEQLRQKRMQIIADADNAYWTYVAVLQKVKLTESYLTQMDTLFNFTRTELEAGMATQEQMLRIDARRSEVDYNLQKARNGADLCRMALCQIIGVDYDCAITPTETDPAAIAPETFVYDITQRPEYKMLTYSIDAAAQQVKLTRGDFLPTLGLGISYNHYGNIKIKGMSEYGEFTQKYHGNNFMGMLSLSVPLFHWGEGIKKVKTAKIEEQNARLDLQRNTRLMEIEIRQAIQNVSAGYMLISAAETAMRQANTSLEMQKQQYEIGMTPLTAYLDAIAQWNASYSNMIEAKTQYRIYQTEYRRVTGILSE